MDAKIIISCKNLVKYYIIFCVLGKFMWRNSRDTPHPYIAAHTPQPSYGRTPRPYIAAWGLTFLTSYKLKGNYRS